MEFIDECKKRQAELLRILQSMNDDPLWAGDELAVERFKRNTQKTISQYEKILHLLNGEQIGHA
jgi:hypothetical protein